MFLIFVFHSSICSFVVISVISLVWLGVRKMGLIRKSLTLYHIILYRVHRLAWVGFELTTLHVIGTDYIGSYKSNYHAITTTTVPKTY
jgi:hypothetical protein